jgi:hypothetical protein
MEATMSLSGASVDRPVGAARAGADDLVDSLTNVLTRLHQVLVRSGGAITETLGPAAGAAGKPEIRDAEIREADTLLGRLSSALALVREIQSEISAIEGVL